VVEESAAGLKLKSFNKDFCVNEYYSIHNLRDLLERGKNILY